MTKLTFEQKKAILRTGRSINILSSAIPDLCAEKRIDFISDLKEKWAGEILGLDFKKDIYKNERVNELNRRDYV